MTLRALVVGGGRMGIGWGGFDAYPFTYCHAKLYREDPRIQLVGIVDPDLARLRWGTNRWETSGYDSIEAGFASKPNIVSICTPPTLRAEILEQMPASVRWVLCEKPFGLVRTDWPGRLQVHYPRRFCRFHRAVRAGLRATDQPELFVWARRDMTTAVHFTNLAEWFNATLIYRDNTGEIPGTNSYRLETGKWAVEFRNGGVVGGFMEAALENLLSDEQLESPADVAARTEEWAAGLVR